MANETKFDKIMGAIPALGTVYGIGQAIFGKSQQDMQNLQIQGQKEMTDYNYGKQIQMIGDSTKAQMQAFKDNNLNTALMYDGAGAGGSSQIQAGGMPTGQVAPNSAELGQFGVQTAMAAANIELMKSQAEKNRVEAEKLAGPDTNLVKTQIDSLTQGITNSKTINEINKIEKDIKAVAATVAEETSQDAIAYIKHEAVRMGGMAKSALVEGKVDEETQKQKIELINKQLANIGADTILKDVQAKTGRAIATRQEFEAELTKLGIGEGTPWYGKLLGAWVAITSTEK